MVGHGLPEGGMIRAPAGIGTRALRDFYVWPFEAAVREAGMRSMMHAYEDVDGVPCVASRELFTTTLRDEWASTGSSSPTTPGSASWSGHNRTAAAPAAPPRWPPGRGGEGGGPPRAAPAPP